MQQQREADRHSGKTLLNLLFVYKDQRYVDYQTLTALAEAHLALGACSMLQD